MQTFRFSTKVSNRGTIKLPSHSKLDNKEVEVIIVTKEYVAKDKNLTPELFIEKWAGFLSNQNTDVSKFSYLMEKYK